MNKYKVEIKETTTYIVDVLADDQQEATDKAQAKWNEVIDNGTYHYYEADTETEIGSVFDVTHTDDPFNP